MNGVIYEMTLRQFAVREPPSLDEKFSTLQRLRCG